MGTRRQARELALQSLYLQDTCNATIESALKSTLAETTNETVREFCEHLTKGVAEKKEDIDNLLIKYAENWDLKRMAAVDRNILRLATFEILTDVNTPVSVIIDEAIEIAKNFSMQDSSKFVNGILDKVKNERKAP